MRVTIIAFVCFICTVNAATVMVPTVRTDLEDVNVQGHDNTGIRKARSLTITIDFLHMGVPMSAPMGDPMSDPMSAPKGAPMDAPVDEPMDDSMGAPTDAPKGGSQGSPYVDGYGPPYVGYGGYDSNYGHSVYELNNHEHGYQRHGDIDHDHHHHGDFDHDHHRRDLVYLLE